MKKEWRNGRIRQTHIKKDREIQTESEVEKKKAIKREERNIYKEGNDRLSLIAA